MRSSNSLGRWPSRFLQPGQAGFPSPPGLNRQAGTLTPHAQRVWRSPFHGPIWTLGWDGKPKGHRGEGSLAMQRGAPGPRLPTQPASQPCVFGGACFGGAGAQCGGSASRTRGWPGGDHLRVLLGKAVGRGSGGDEEEEQQQQQQEGARGPPGRAGPGGAAGPSRHRHVSIQDAARRGGREGGRGRGRGQWRSRGWGGRSGLSSLLCSPPSCAQGLRDARAARLAPLRCGRRAGSKRFCAPGPGPALK